MKRRFRLRRHQDFDRVIAAQRVFAGRAMLAFAHPNPSGELRVGVTVSRKLRRAVDRNRARRRLREAVRRRLPPAGTPAERRPPGYDIVLIGRPAVLDVPLSVLEEEAAAVCARLCRR